MGMGHPLQHHLLRASALPTAALLAIAIGAIGLVAVRAATAGISGEANLIAAAAAERDAAQAVDRYLADLARNPSLLFDGGWEAEDGSAAERDRDCDDPGPCPLPWDYAAPDAGADFDGPAVRLEVSPPISDDATFTVRALARRGRIDRGVQTDVRFTDAGTMTVATDGDLNLAEFATDGGLGGLVYAGGVLVAPAGSSAGPALLAGECAVATDGADGTVRTATAGSSGDGCQSPGGTVDDVRRYLRDRFSAAGAASAIRLTGEACDGSGRDGVLCLTDEAEPPAAWHLRLADGDRVQVRRSAESLSDTVCTIRCDYPAHFDDGGLDDPLRWTEEEALQDLPASGLIVADRPVVVTADDELTAHVAVVGVGGGDLWVGSSISAADDASLTLATTAGIRLPWWAADDGGDLTVDGHLVAVGPAPAVATHPTRVGPVADNLTVAGSIVAAGLRGGDLDGYATVTLTPERRVGGWLPGTSGTFSPTAQRPFTAVDACDAARCDGF